MSNRFNSFRKGISKVKNISPKIKGNLNHKKKSSSKSKSSIEYIVPENSPLRKNSVDSDLDDEFLDSDYLDGLSEGVSYTRPVDLDGLPEAVSYTRPVDLDGLSENEFYTSSEYYSNDYNQDNYGLDGVDEKYAKYIFGDNSSDKNFKDPRDSNYREDFDNNDGFNSDIKRDRKFQNDFNENYGDFKNFNNDLDNNDENYNNSYLDENYSDFSYFNDLNDDYSKTDLNNGSIKDSNSKNLKSKLLNFKKDLLNKDDHSKNRFGKIVFILIFLVLSSSLFYFFVYQPFQDELNLEKNSKLNELNTLYKGPLEAHENAYTLRSQIESENDINELKLMDILMYATKDWRTYHSSKIVSSKDNFGRVMLVYGDENKNVIMSVKDANDFVKDNDGRVLSNIRFEKVDTTIVPISISRLQATAGLISVGSIVDIYSLKDNYSYGGESDDLSNTDSGLSNTPNESSDNLEEVPNDENNNLEEDQLNVDNSDSETGLSKMSADSDLEDDSSFSQGGEPDVSGATVLAILRSKDSGVIDSSISRSNTLIDGNKTDPYENTSSYSNDVEELLKASVFNSYDDNKALESYLDSYGIK